MDGQRKAYYGIIRIMLTILTSKTDTETLKKIAKDLDGYVKVVVDIQKRIMTAGGTRHVDGEQLLLAQGCKQENLWGGGIDLETKEIDYDSMINIRPTQGNPSREVLSMEIRSLMEELITLYIL